MISRNSLLAGTALAAMLTTAHAARADLIQWSLAGVFDDGGTFAGSFTYDTSATTVTSWGVVTTTGTTLPGASYTSADPEGGAGEDGSGGTHFYHLDGVLGPYAFYADLDFANLALATPGTVGALEGFEGPLECFLDVECGLDGPGRDIVAGSAVGLDVSAPEPASGSLALAGIAILGAYRRRRRAV